MRLRRPCIHDRYERHPEEDALSSDFCPGGAFLPEGALVIEKVEAPDLDRLRQALAACDSWGPAYQRKAYAPIVAAARAYLAKRDAPPPTKVPGSSGDIYRGDLGPPRGRFDALASQVGESE